MEKTKGRGTVAEIATQTPSTTDETDMKLYLTQFDTYSAVMQQVAYLADFEHKLCDLSSLLYRVLDEPYGMSRYLSTRLWRVKLRHLRYTEVHQHVRTCHP